jgi:hypothetical protein
VNGTSHAVKGICDFSTIEYSEIYNSKGFYLKKNFSMESVNIRLTSALPKCIVHMQKYQALLSYFITILHFYKNYDGGNSE